MIEKFSDYSSAASRTHSGGPEGFDGNLLVATLGLSGEVGEICEMIKKWVGHGHDLDKNKLTKEVGDVDGDFEVVLFLADDMVEHYKVENDVVAESRMRYESRKLPFWTMLREKTEWSHV